MKAFVLSEYILTWFKRYPAFHRTDQQGTRIICPQRTKFGHPAETFHGRASHQTKCRSCGARLGHIQPIPNDLGHQGEWQWPTIG